MNPTRRQCHIAIIGTGSAGLAAHAAARRHTDSLLLIEAGDYGTTCARTGCMPSKLLIAAADARHHVDMASGFGIRTGATSVDGAAVMRRVRTLRDRFVGGVRDIVDGLPEQQRLRGIARFTAPYRLQVDEVEVLAERIVIASGSHPFVPAPYDRLGPRLLTSDTLFELNDLPESVAVIGGGVIGLEIGQALHRLGVRVRLFERGHRLGPRGDAAIEAVATALLGASLPTELGGVPEIAVVDDDGVCLCWHSAGGERRSERFERVLVATGRRPNVAQLELQHSGLALDAHGVPLFDRNTLRCGDSRIFIAGDVNADRPLLHEATAEGRIAGDNAALLPDFRAHRRTTALAIAFTDPQFATIGVQPADPRFAALVAGEVSFEDQGRSRVIGRNAGLGRLYGEPASGKLCGAQLIGPQVEHLAHLLAWIIERELTVNEALALPFYHPVIEEGLRTALKDLRREMHRGSGPRNDCLECGPGT